MSRSALFGVGLVALAGCIPYEIARPESAPVAEAGAPRPPSVSSPRAAEEEAESADVAIDPPGELDPPATDGLEDAGASSAVASRMAVPADTPFLQPLTTQVTEAQRVSERIANASPATCRAELKRRKLPVAFVGGNVKGIATPLRLTGELRGVRFIAPGKKSVYGMLDCRLAIVLDELAGLLAAHGVAAVHVDNMYRPRAHLPGRKKKSQHAYGLAIDIYGFTLADGTMLVIERDFHGTIGAATCGPEAFIGAGGNASSVTLRNLVCAIAAARVFNYLLTPDYDAAHRNHLHADIGRGNTGHVLR